MNMNDTKTKPAATKLDRPKPHVRAVKQEELDWDPICLPQFTLVDDVPVRSGDAYAVVRPGHERWPLGHVSGVYRPSSHRSTVNMLLEAAGDKIEPRVALMAGNGSRVMHEFRTTRSPSENAARMDLCTSLVVVHDHTGLHALKARMVIYSGKNVLGSLVGARAIHVAEQPEQWRAEVETMLTRSESIENVVVDIVEAAVRVPIGPAETLLLESQGIKMPKPWPSNLLDVVIGYHHPIAKGKDKGESFGIWSRRLNDTALVACVEILGKKEYGVRLDLALGGMKYGGAYTEAARRELAKQEKAA